MTSQLIALVLLIVAGFVNTLGNFWFTYGIWPRSWVAFALFFATGLSLSLMVDAVRKDIHK